MEITTQNLTSLFTGFELAPTYYEKICSVVPSSSRQNLYPWLGRTTKFREWLGPRVLQQLETHGYTLINKNFENTVSVDRNDIEDDTYGVYTPLFEQLAWDAKTHPDMLVFGMLKLASTTPSEVKGYDGAAFFGNHSVGIQGVGDITQANLDSGGSGAYWYLVDASRPIRPFIFQKRREYTITRMNSLTDEVVFNQRQFRFGVDGRANTGVGLWQLCYASNQDLSNPANYASARSAMRGFKSDGGQPFGALASGRNIYLVVPPSLEGVARQLLNSEFMVGTGTSNVTTTNIWKGSAELIVSEYLS